MQLAIDQDLLRQAHQATGLGSDRDLVEYGLRLAIAAQALKPPLRPPRAGACGKASDSLGASCLEAPDAPSVYRGPPLSDEAMAAAVLAEAARHK